MSVDSNKEIARRFHTCDLDDYGQLMSDDFVGHDAMGHTWDRAFGMAGLAADLQSFAGLHDDIHDIIAEGDRVAVRFSRSGTFVPKFEDFEPTHREVKFDVIEILLMRNGKIQEGWFYNDDSTIARALRAHE